jgi:hypothetical protein
LLARLLPMLVLAIVGSVILAGGSRLFTAMEVGRASPDLTEVASQGPTLVARALMALGIDCRGRACRSHAAGARARRALVLA